MEWLKKLAPLLGAALGGPLGGAAAAFLADRLGVDSKTVSAVTDVLNSGKMTPEQISAIRLAEIEFQKFLESNKIKLEEIQAADRGSARTMQAATKSAMPAVLTLLITFGFFGVLGWMLYDTTVVDNPPLLIMLGSLGTAWTGACAFWFGTTSGSKAKTDLIANSAPIK
jgi:gas vesicle protein